jgi:hypothetical protein
MKNNKSSRTLEQFKFGYACCNSVQTLLLSGVLRTTKPEIKRKILILSLALYSLAVKRDLSYKRKRRVLRRIFVNRKEEVAGDWKKLHNEKLHNLYCLQKVIMLNRGEHDSLDI